jgi:hypothetical protein
VVCADEAWSNQAHADTLGHASACLA